MPLDTITKQLLEEIKILKDRRGFLRTGFRRVGRLLAREDLTRRRKLRKELFELRDVQGYLRAGKPSFNRLFGRDSLIAAWQLLNWNSNICKATLEILSQLQGKIVNNEREEEPGKILHETSLDGEKQIEGHFPFPYYGTVDATPLFLIVFSFYLKKTNDKKFLAAHWENILMAVNWIEEYGDQDKDLFLEYERKNPTGLFHQGWKDSWEDHLKIEPPVAIVEAQGYQYLALLETADLAVAKKDLGLRDRLRNRAGALKKEFNSKFWIDDKKWFALALDGSKHQRTAVVSNMGHLLFTGIIDKDKVEYVVGRLFAEDLWTPYGIRTHATSEPDFEYTNYHLGSIWPHDNWIIAQGLKKLGYIKEYKKIRAALFAAFRHIGFLPEFYCVDLDGKIKFQENANYPQAWATGAMVNLLGLSLPEKMLQLPRRVFMW